MEDYVKAIYHLESEVPEDEDVRTSAIAEELDVTPPTVTSMLDKLEDRDLIDREKYGGIELTPDGQRVALEVIRHHRLLEAFLTEHLDYQWSEVHEEADRLEHHISEEFEERVAQTLTDPHRDPHGDPIPSAELEPPEDHDEQALTDFEPGERVVVSRVRDRDPDVLQYLGERNVDPGTELIVVDVAPFGMVTVQPTTGDDVSLPKRIAHDVRVTPAE